MKSTNKKDAGEEFMDYLLSDEGKAATQKFHEDEMKSFDKMHDEFLEQHDFLEKPSLQSRQAGAWTRENILLDSWNQFLNCEARRAEFFGIYPEGKGFREINNTRRCDIALNFAHYFLASMKEQVKLINEEFPETK